MSTRGNLSFSAYHYLYDLAFIQPHATREIPKKAYRNLFHYFRKPQLSDPTLPYKAHDQASQLGEFLDRVNGESYLHAQATKRKLMSDSKTLLECCLYFTANNLARTITRMAEEAFSPLGLSPSQAFLVMLANEFPGISASDMASQLHLAPSTVTRLVDGLIRKDFVERRIAGKASLIHPTPRAKELAPEIEAAWKRLYHNYSDVLGENAGRELTGLIHDAFQRLD